LDEQAYVTKIVYQHKKLEPHFKMCYPSYTCLWNALTTTIITVSVNFYHIETQIYMFLNLLQ